MARSQAIWRPRVATPELRTRDAEAPRCYFRTSLGEMVLGDAIDVLRQLPDDSVDLVMTSPPFALVRKKDYGNVSASDYVRWFSPFAAEMRRVLKPSGSLVIDIGGSWVPGWPVRSLYHFKLLVALCEDFGFHLAQEFFWWNPARLPTPAEWVTVRRIRVKDAVNCVWWLSRTPWPKASNRRVLQPYSDSMIELLRRGYTPKKRPSGHDISSKFGRDNGAAIPPNLLAIANTESNGSYLRYCREHGIKPHPARYPEELPEFFIRMLTDPGDFVVDPFAGSCVTGAVCERLGRRWLCCEIEEEYLKGALGRFHKGADRKSRVSPDYYRIPRPGVLWNGTTDEPMLCPDGGRKRQQRGRAWNMRAPGGGSR
jgi:DNA modification methylase